MNVQIFTVHHEIPQNYIATDIFKPFVNGLSLGPHPDLIADDRGDNIADRVSYGDMRAQYFVWKNRRVGMDYVGFQQYRRAFLLHFMVEPNQASEIAATCVAALKYRNLTFVTVERRAFIRYLRWLESWDAARIALFKEWLSHFDIVVPRAMTFGIPLSQQYAQRHRAEDWPKLVDAIRQHPRFANKPYLDFDLLRLVPCNMFIMRASWFNDYLGLWHDIMTALEKSVVVPNDPYQLRVFAFLSERLFTIYLHQLQLEHPTLRILELPYLYHDTTAI